MARDPYSVSRSIARYVARILGDDWEDVRPAEVEGSFDRPYALVEQVGGRTVGGSAMLADVSVPITISAFPRSHEDADEAWRIAMQTVERLEDGFASDLYPPGAPYRIPLYDYSEVPMDATTDDRAHCDYLRVTQPVGISPVKDAEDKRLWMIAVDFRCGYRRLGRVPYGGIPTEAVTLEVGEEH